MGETGLFSSLFGGGAGPQTLLPDTGAGLFANSTLATNPSVLASTTQNLVPMTMADGSTALSVMNNATPTIAPQTPGLLSKAGSIIGDMKLQDWATIANTGGSLWENAMKQKMVKSQLATAEQNRQNVAEDRARAKAYREQMAKTFGNTNYYTA